MDPKSVQRFMKKVELTDNGCWEWRGFVHKNGYGSFRVGAAMRYSHRVSYDHFRGDLVDGLVVSHECDNRRCVNPFHLKQCSQSENLQDMSRRGRHSRYNAKKTHCKRGHILSPDSIYDYSAKRGRPDRQCKKCKSLLKLKSKGKHDGLCNL